MSDGTKIEWTDATWNPVTGCAKVSQGCKNCYAERDWKRLSAMPQTVYFGRKFTDVATHNDRLGQPLRWKRPRRIFVNSMSDLFHLDVPDDFIERVFAVMAHAKQHTFQVLTKRPDRMRHVARYIADINGRPLPNVWLGVSVEDQETADERIPILLDTPAAVRWISAEPLLGPINLHERLDWVVAGGESGPNARPMHPDWLRSLRDQCNAAGVDFLFKQWGEWHTKAFLTSTGEPVFRQFDSFQHWVNKARTWVNGGICLDKNGAELKNGGDMMRARNEDRFPVTIMHRVGKRAAGRLLDGRTWDEYPEARR